MNTKERPRERMLLLFMKNPISDKFDEENVSGLNTSDRTSNVHIAVDVVLRRNSDPHTLQLLLNVGTVSRRRATLLRDQKGDLRWKREHFDGRRLGTSARGESCSLRRSIRGTCTFGGRTEISGMIRIKYRGVVISIHFFLDDFS
jgi:hypothetical protein